MSVRTIALIHPHKALLPEVGVYARYFERHGYETRVFAASNPRAWNGFDVEWHFMGLDLRRPTPGRIKIHEYVSGSVPPMPRLKDRIKRWVNVRPDARVFGNALLAQRLQFAGNVPALIRPAGIDPSFLSGEERASPEYDLVYCGAMDEARNLVPWIAHVLAGLPGAKLLLVGPPSDAMWQAFKAHPGVVFSGHAPYAEVPGLLAKAEYGLNLIPDRYPFHIQTPLKFLEYCAVGLKVISTPTAWIRQFERQRQGRFFYLGEKGPALSWERLRHFPFATPPVDDLAWDRLLESSGIPALLERLTE